MNMDKFNRKMLVRRLATITGAVPADLNRAFLFLSNGLVPKSFSFVENLSVAAADGRNDQLAGIVKAVRSKAAQKDIAA